MTKLVLDISNPSDLEVLIPLLRRLRIAFSKIETEKAKPAEVAEAIRVVRQGCDMTAFGDALQYQIESRKDRSLPFREE